jgi:hypothetical protein
MKYLYKKIKILRRPYEISVEEEEEEDPDQRQFA